MRHGWDAQHAISDPYVLYMHTFVDDPIHITRGDDDTKVLALPRALLWAVRAKCSSATPAKVVVTSPMTRLMRPSTRRKSFAAEIQSSYSHRTRRWVW
jgi:hypothetical protein